jgi:hypothetical protein
MVVRNMNIIRYKNKKRSKLYVCWINMKQRCLNKNHKDFYRYGGRGITICDEWLDFETFAKWAIHNGYSDELTLDRIDNNSGYCPHNCRWTTMQQQSTNRRKPITNTSGYMCVTKRKNGKYVAELMRKGKHIFLGYYKTPEEASVVYNRYIKEVLHERCID